MVLMITKITSLLRKLTQSKKSGVDIHVSADIMSKENPVRGAPRNGVTPTVMSRITNEFIVGCGGDPFTIYSSYSYANTSFQRNFCLRANV